MRIDIKIESDGQPLLILWDEPASQYCRKLTYARIGEHSEATIDYIKGLKEPASTDEIVNAWRLLEMYAGMQG